MKIEIIPWGKGFSVLFLDWDLAEVQKIRNLSFASLSGMGYRLKADEIEECRNILFFNVKSSVDDRKLGLSDLYRSLDEATKRVEREG